MWEVCTPNFQRWDFIFLRSNYLFISETIIDPSTWKLAISSYLPLIVKIYLWNHHSNIFGTHIMDVFLMWQRPPKQGPLFQSMCFCRALVHTTSFIFPLYYAQDDGTVMFNKIAKTLISSLRILLLVFIFVPILIFNTKCD